MYKVGDKFIIEISEVPVFKYEKYRISTGLSISKNALDELKKVPTDDAKDWVEMIDAMEREYNRGLNDAWELLKKVNNMYLDAMNKCFDLEELDKFGAERMLYKHFTPQEALAKLGAYEKEQEIKVGDEVEVVGATIKGYVIDKSQENEDCYVVLITNYKHLHTAVYNKTVIEKTGEHIDIAGILEQIN